jgi:flagellar biosynthesis protein FliQ
MSRDLMSDVAFYDLLRQGLWVSVAMSAPMLTAALAAGLTVGLFQALTSVQEMTLTFVPKIAAMLVVFWVSMSLMTGLLVDYFHGHVLPAMIGG